jgi:hypothetical protein
MMCDSRGYRFLNGSRRLVPHRRQACMTPLCDGDSQKSQIVQEYQDVGGAEGIRTPDLCSAIAALSHLSYSPGQALGDGMGPVANRAAAF